MSCGLGGAPGGGGPPEGHSSVMIVTLQGKRAAMRADGCHCIDDGRELHRHPPLSLYSHRGHVSIRRLIVAELSCDPVLPFGLGDGAPRPH
jgi:hypothetical protein